MTVARGAHPQRKLYVEDVQSRYSLTRMADSETIIEQTITHDLFGSAGLTEPAEVELPEKYEVLECLGRGGCGIVYKVRDTALDRLVAVKFLRDARPSDLERFRREARFTARLQDPAIVQIFELGEFANRPYIVMQYIDGVRLDHAGQTSEQVLRIMSEVADALVRAHAEGIVHRDIKPANILIDGAGRAYLTDFGVARDLAAGAHATLSHDGAIIGTPALMAPEQARGALAAIDGRTDVYAVGATLYLLLCGRYPFTQRNLPDLLHAIIHEEPPLPRALNPEIPRAVEDIILKSMARSRADRYRTMGDLASAIRANLAGDAAPPPASAWFRKLVGGDPLPADDGPGSDSLDKLSMDVARELASWDANLYRVSRNLNRYYPALDALIARLEQLVAERPDAAWVRFHLGSALARRPRLDEALDAMERSIDRLADRASAQFEIGRVYLALYLRDLRQAYKHMSRIGVQKHLTGARKRLRQAQVAFLAARGLKSDTLDWQHRFADAVARLADEDFIGCIAACDAILQDDPDLEEVWKLRGDAQRISVQEGGAVADAAPFESYEEALRIRRSFLEAYYASAECHIDRQQWTEARAVLERARQVDSDDVHVLALCGELCLNESEASGDETRLDDGIACLEQAAAIDADNYEIALTRARIYLARGGRNSDAADLEMALGQLEHASRLAGCQNRVKFFQARTHVERARLRLAAGLPIAGDITQALELEDHMRKVLPENDPWIDLFREARQLGETAHKHGSG